MKKLKLKHWLLLFSVVIAIVIASAVSIFFSGGGFTAEVADNILRPIFGEKTTLELESAYFGVSEKVKAIRYSISPVQEQVFLDENVGTGKEKNQDNLNLFPIAVTHNFALLPGEGEWKVVDSALFPNEVVMAKTFVRPDATKSYANVALLQFDMKRFGIKTEAGIKYPGGTLGVKGPGFVPKQVQDSGNLVAVFNGGFQEKDGHYGMIVGGTTYVPMRENMATLYMYADGTFKLADYLNLPDPKAVAMRQNGPYLVHNGEITQFVEEGKDTWGRTTTNSMYTWRSGIGVTKEGNLIYAVGGSLIPRTLGEALRMAGAVDAIQLDINPFWVRMFFYKNEGSGQYSSTPLLPSMKVGAKEFLQGYEKDMFYIYKK